MNTRFKTEVNPGSVTMTQVFIFSRFQSFSVLMPFMLSPFTLNTNYQGFVLGISSKDLSDNFVNKHLRS